MKFSQVESKLKGTDAPGKMCDSCHQIYKDLRDKSVKCRVPGCTEKWNWSRWMQLESRLKGKTKAPRRICATCQDKLDTYPPKEVPCKHDGCEKTWNWSPEMQLSAVLRGFSIEKPPQRMCEDCHQFIEEAKTQKLQCEKCTREIVWTREHQLHVRLGIWTKPTRCSDCIARK